MQNYNYVDSPVNYNYEDSPIVSSHLIRVSSITCVVNEWHFLISLSMLLTHVINECRMYFFVKILIKGANSQTCDTTKGNNIIDCNLENILWQVKIKKIKKVQSVVLQNIMVFCYLALRNHLPIVSFIDWLYSIGFQGWICLAMQSRQINLFPHRKRHHKKTTI